MTTDKTILICTNEECPTFRGQIANPDTPTFCICDEYFTPFVPASELTSLQTKLEIAIEQLIVLKCTMEEIFFRCIEHPKEINQDWVEYEIKEALNKLKGIK